LHRMLNEHAIFSHLEHVRGLDHIHATSKVELGTALLATLGCDPAHVLFVGDTLHDHETASAMGCHCLLFTRGHQHPARFSGIGVDVIDQLRDIHDIIDAHDKRTGRLT
jgi:phosphoglycolate phosphatase